MEMAVVLVFAGLIAVLGMKYVGGGAGNSKCYQETQQKLQRVRDALNRYAQSNDRFPRPALRTVGSDSPLFGKEVPVADIGKLDKASDGGSPPAYSLFGALPFSTITISRDDAVDCWGNKLTYVVTEELTVEKDMDGDNPFQHEVKGAFGVKTDATKPEFFLDEAGFAVISHGADELGAVKENYQDLSATPAKKWCTLDAALWGKTENCEVSNNILISRPLNDGKNATADFFDDVIVYRGKPWIQKTEPCECKDGVGPENIFTASPNCDGCSCATCE